VCSTTPLALPLQSHEVLRRTVEVCEWVGSHCFDVRHTILQVLQSEVSRCYVVTGDALSATAMPLARSELLALPESVSRRLAAYFVRLVENDLNSSRPAIVYVPSRWGLRWLCRFVVAALLAIIMHRSCMRVLWQ
jgi:hypothetical protein